MQSNILNKKLFARTLYNRNGVIHLIILLATCYIAFHAVKIAMTIASVEKIANLTEAKMWPYIALFSVEQWLSKPWTLISYFFVEQKLMMLLVNLIWLYIFGSVVQTLLGFKEIFPMYLAVNLVTGILFLITNTFLPVSPHFMLNGMTFGIIGFGISALLIAPSFRFYISEHFSFPLWAAFLIFFVLSVVLRNNLMMYILAGFAGLASYLYTSLIKRGWRPGEKWFKVINKINQYVDGESKNPEPILRNSILNEQHAIHENERKLNELLEKIHQQGMESLSQKEKELLEKLSANH